MPGKFNFHCINFLCCRTWTGVFAVPAAPVGAGCFLTAVLKQKSFFLGLRCDQDGPPCWSYKHPTASRNLHAYARMRAPHLYVTSRSGRYLHEYSRTSGGGSACGYMPASLFAVFTHNWTIAGVSHVNWGNSEHSEGLVMSHSHNWGKCCVIPASFCTRTTARRSRQPVDQPLNNICHVWAQGGWGVVPLVNQGPVIYTVVRHGKHQATQQSLMLCTSDSLAFW